MYFEYGNEETTLLKKKDRLLGSAIEQIGHIHREVDSDLFTSVIRHIIGQQISTSAQKTIWQRLVDKIGVVNVKTISELGLNELQKVGLTHKKVGYIKDFALKIKNDEFDIHSLHRLPDDAVIEKLTAIRGIGNWTAEMVMLFGMQRPDIVSFGDLGIRRGMKMLYRLSDIDSEQFAKYKKRYSPHGSVASLYLWAIAGGAIPDGL